MAKHEHEDSPPNVEPPAQPTSPPLDLDLEHAAEAPTMLPPDPLSADPVLALLQEMKRDQADDRIEMRTRLSRLEGYAKVLEGNLLILRADAEETKRDVKTVDAKVDQIKREAAAAHQILEGVGQLSKSTYDMVTELKRGTHDQRGESAESAKAGEVHPLRPHR